MFLAESAWPKNGRHWQGCGEAQAGQFSGFRADRLTPAVSDLDAAGAAGMMRPRLSCTNL
jgi:hypothetical protein